MIEGKNLVFQAFLGTLMTWALTAAGSALVFIFVTGQFAGKRKILDGSLGFAAGVMTAASFWSLLAPAIEMAKESGNYGAEGQYAFVPVAIGFGLGGAFVLLSDLCLPTFTKQDPSIALALHANEKNKEEANTSVDISDLSLRQQTTDLDIENSLDVDQKHKSSSSSSIEMNLKKRHTKDCITTSQQYENESDEDAHKKQLEIEVQKLKSWKRMLLLIIAITVHNIPEGLAVGVGFGAIGSSPSATFASARNLAIGIGIQNFPEGMAVSIPLCAAGYTPLKSFFYGQLSGMVEPIFGVLGALAVTIATPLLPYALSFAAGAMIYVVADDLIPEANMCDNGRVASWGCMVGFIVMMALDVGLG